MVKEVAVVEGFRHREAVFVLVFNMGGSMRVFRHVTAPRTRQVFAVHIHHFVLERKIYDLEELDPNIPVHRVEFGLDGVFFYNVMPQDMVVWGPFENLESSMFYFEPRSDFVVYNMSGKLKLDVSLKSLDVFKAKYHGCVQTRPSMFGSMCYLYHLHGNVHHQNRSNVVFFKGFKRTGEVEDLMREVLDDYVWDRRREGGMEMNMFATSCNLGVYVDISEFSTVRYMIDKLFHRQVVFVNRHDQDMNLVTFNIKDVQGFFPLVDPRWTGACHCLNCTITRKGVLVVRISWTSSMAWSRYMEGVTFNALGVLQRKILECV